MSDVQNNGAGGSDGKPEVTGDEFVTKKAYEEVTSDMHKYKSKFKEAAAAKAEYEAKLKAVEEQKLQEQQQWQKLYETTKSELEQTRNQYKQKEESFSIATKKAALKSELGSNIKDVYLDHADIKSIEMNEYGLIDRDSLLAVANKFREEHSGLLPQQSGGSATSLVAQGIPPARPKNINEMSTQEKMEYLRTMKNRS